MTFVLSLCIFTIVLLFMLCRLLLPNVQDQWIAKKKSQKNIMGIDIENFYQRKYNLITFHYPIFSILHVVSYHKNYYVHVFQDIFDTLRDKPRWQVEPSGDQPNVLVTIYNITKKKQSDCARIVDPRPLPALFRFLASFQIL